MNRVLDAIAAAGPRATRRQAVIREFLAADEGAAPRYTIRPAG